jgi:hypothetical protein
MAKIRKNGNILKLSGSIGDLVFRQMPDGSTRVSAKPDFSRRKFSEGQKDHQNRFKEASAYAREAAKTQPIYAELAEGTTKSAYNWALSNWFNPPEIQRIERKGDVVRVQASDNVLVTEVRVKILDSEGNLREAGQAEQVSQDWWEYAASTEGKVEATARDLPGHVTVQIMDLTGFGHLDD